MLNNKIVVEEQDQSPNENEVKKRILKAWEYRQRVKAKYSLPECGSRWENPALYISEIQEFAKKEGIKIGFKHEFEEFFEENPNAAAVSLGESVFRPRTIVTEIPNYNDFFSLRAVANQMSHEIVHAMQDKYAPQMPDEEAEREAYYYQMLTPQKLIENAQNLTDILYFIDNVIERSVLHSVENNRQIN